MPITLNGTTGITTPDLDSTGDVTANGLSTPLRPLISDTPKTASGSSVEFTGIPSWVKRITMTAVNVSLTTNDIMSLQLGTSSGWDGTGNYSYAAWASSSTGTTAIASDIAGAFNLQFANAGNSVHSTFVLTLLGNNTWLLSGNQVSPSTYTGGATVAGRKVLTGTLDRVRLVSLVAGTFDAGTINIMWE